MARGRYLLLLNSDTVVLEGGVKKIVAYLDSHPDVGIATGRVLNPDKTFQRPFRRFPHWLGAIVRHTFDLVKKVDHPIERNFRLSHLDEHSSHEVDWVTGAYLFLRRELLDKGKVFDEKLHMYYEDTLLCYRARASGYRVIYCPYAPIIHYHGASARQMQQNAIFLSYKSSVHYFRKVYGDATARIYSLAVRFIWGALAIGFTLLQVLSIPKLSKKAALFRKLASRGFTC
jgi:GT2 family glycosyltransferase